MGKLITISGSHLGKFDIIEHMSNEFLQLKRYTNRPDLKIDENKYLNFTKELRKNCDIIYSHWSNEYGISSEEIQKQILAEKDSYIFISNLEIIKLLKKKFGKAIYSIWFDSPLDNRNINFGELNLDKHKKLNEITMYETLLKKDYNINTELFDLNLPYQLDRENIPLRIKSFLLNTKQSKVFGLEDNEILSEIESDLIITNNRLLEFFQKYPNKLYELTPRNFEILIAELLSKYGYEITLSPKIKDGGYDIRAIKKDGIGEFLYLIDCKRYRRDRPVGVELVRQINTVRQIYSANKAGIVTTSHFTTGAIELKRNFAFEIDLHNFDDIRKWLINYENAATNNMYHSIG